MEIRCSEKEIRIFEKIGKAAETYASEVRSRTFPSANQTYRPKGS